MLQEALTLSCIGCVTFAIHRQVITGSVCAAHSPATGSTCSVCHILNFSSLFSLAFRCITGNKNARGHSGKVKHHKIRGELWKATRRGSAIKWCVRICICE